VLAWRPRQALRQIGKQLTQSEKELAVSTHYADSLKERLDEERQAWFNEREKLLDEKENATLAIRHAEKELAIMQQSLDGKQKELQEWEKMKDQMLKAATASVMESGSKLSSKLLEDHKRETEAARKEGEEQVRKTTEAMFTQVKEVVEQVG